MWRFMQISTDMSWQTMSGFTTSAGKREKTIRSSYSYAHGLGIIPPDFRNLLEAPKLKAQSPLTPYLGNEEWQMDWVSLEIKLPSRNWLFLSPHCMDEASATRVRCTSPSQRSTAGKYQTKLTIFASFELQYFPKIDRSASFQRAILVVNFSNR